MQKMQKVAPEVRAIQNRYKKYSMNDPRKRKMNEEVMAVYSREGINPFGSCLPMLVQFPILLGALSHAWRRDRVAPRAVVRVDSRSIGARSLLHFADRHERSRCISCKK